MLTVWESDVIDNIITKDNRKNVISSEILKVAL